MHRPESPSVAADRFLELARARHGHFRLESGHHTDMWFDLNGLFTDHQRIAPLVTRLSDRLRDFRPDGICGPLVGGAFLAQRVAAELGLPFFFTERSAQPARDELYTVRYRVPSVAIPRVRHLRLAIVDDVMSAGSALRGTYASLREHDADVVVAGALMVLGDVGAKFFSSLNVPVEAVLIRPFNVWAPAECPLCQRGSAIADPVAAGYDTA